LFQAIARFKTKYSKPFRCVVVGDGPQRVFLCDLARELGIDDEVVFTGIVNDLPRILAALDLIVVPSHTEASSRVVLEAGAMGIPSIGTRIGGIPEMIQEGVTGLLVPLGDIDALAEALHCLQEESLRKTMGKRASVWVHEVFCNKKITSQIENIYLSLLRKRSENH
jgi:glycosyltransferase involved in cell wall biosynthesis